MAPKISGTSKHATLQRRVAELEMENARLRVKVDELETQMPEKKLSKKEAKALAKAEADDAVDFD